MLELPLQPLRIPSQWKVEINNFTEADPSDYPNPDDDAWLCYFIEDILYLTTVFRKAGTISEISVDLGWYPEGNPKGQFRLVAVQNYQWETPLNEFCSGNKQEIIKTLEKWLIDYSSELYFQQEASEKSEFLSFSDNP